MAFLPPKSQRANVARRKSRRILGSEQAIEKSGYILKKKGAPGSDKFKTGSTVRYKNPKVAVELGKTRKRKLR